MKNLIRRIDRQATIADRFIVDRVLTPYVYTPARRHAQPRKW